MCTHKESNCSHACVYYQRSYKFFGITLKADMQCMCAMCECIVTYMYQEDNVSVHKEAQTEIMSLLFY